MAAVLESCFLLFSTVLLGLLCQHCVEAQNFDINFHRLEQQQHAWQQDSVPGLQKYLTEAEEALLDLWTGLDKDQDGGNSVDYSESCVESMASISLPELETLVDATGKLGAGLVTGNTLMSGAFDECFNHNFTSFCLAPAVHINSTKFNISSQVLKITRAFSFAVGLCVPKYCNRTDVAMAINSTGIVAADQAKIVCADSKTPDWSAGAVVMVVVTMVFFAMVICGTVLDAVLKESCKKDSVSINGEGEKLALLEKEERKGKCCRVSSLDFLKAFSLFQTVPSLLATKQGPGMITCLNGLRVISMSWVILGHSYSFLGTLMNVDNYSVTKGVLSRFSFQAVENAFFSVDSFFFLSGVLVAYLTLKEMRRLDGRFPFLHFYIHRYLRLTPTLAFVMFFAWFLTDHLSYGPFMALYNPFGVVCSKYWWTNLLYINNLYPWKLEDECIGWAWYLANDMQFYIISPLILYLIYHWFYVGVVIIGVFLVTGFVITASLAAVYDYQASMFSVLAYNYTNKPGSPISFTDAVYIKPWARISPYLVGLVLGYVLYQRYKFGVRRRARVVLYGLMWAVAAFVAMWLVYGLYFTWQHRPSPAENVLYITFSRCLWGCCLALVVLACHHDYGWVVNAFLSMKFWTPLARMTFSAYLVHPVVILVVYGQLQTPIHYTDLTLACYFVSFVVISYAVAAVLCVLVEFPLGTIEMLVFKLFGYKGRESRGQEQLLVTDRNGALEKKSDHHA